MRKTVVAVFCVIIATSGVLPPFVSADWSMFRSDPEHSSIGTYNPKGDPVLNPTQLWKTNFTWTADQMEAWTKERTFTEPVVIDDTVYVGVSSTVIFGRFEGYLWTDVYALNAINGTQIWAYRIDSPQITNLAFANGILYFGQNHDNHIFYALNASTGTLVWNATVDFSIHSSPTVVDGIVYIGGVMGLFYALNASNGDIIWTANGSNVVGSSPAVANGIVYVGSSDGVHALNASNGGEIWNYFGGDFQGSCSVVKGVVYAISYWGDIYALDASSGDKLWNYSIGYGVGDHNPSFAIMNDVVYARNGLAYFYAFNAVSGAKIWNFTFGEYDNSAPTALNDVVCFGAYNGLYALNASNGKLLWNYTKSGGFGSSGVSPVVVNGVAYVSDFTIKRPLYGDRQLYAIAIPYTPPSQPPFPVVPVAGAIVAVAVVAGLLIYLKKRKH